jgi:diguanylate cyclase
MSDHTVRIAEKTIETIKNLALPADPPSYQLWYTYVSGHNRELNDRIDRALAFSGAPSLSELDDIYLELLAPKDQNAGPIGNRISQEIEKMVAVLSEVVAATSETRNDCAEVARSLAQPVDQKSLRAMADSLIASLRSVETQHATLEKQLESSRHELKSLQQALTMVAVEASRDPVTGLANRRCFDRTIEAMAERAKIDRQPFSLLMIDIDHFKRFNDRLGHLIGDSILKLVGSVLSQSMREDDLVARFGGEEYAMLLSNADLDAAISIAERVRTTIMGREMKRRSTGENLGKITVSVGAATYRIGEDPRNLIKRADACLYEAKATGRNKTCSEAVVRDAAAPERRASDLRAKA